MDAETKQTLKQALCNKLGVDSDLVAYIGVGWMGGGTIVDFVDGSTRLYDDTILTADLAKIVYPDEIFDSACTYISLAFDRSP